MEFPILFTLLLTHSNTFLKLFLSRNKITVFSCFLYSKVAAVHCNLQNVVMYIMYNL